MRAFSPHPCPRCGSEKWNYIDRDGCSVCSPYTERDTEPKPEPLAWKPSPEIGWAICRHVERRRRCEKQAEGLALLEDEWLPMCAEHGDPGFVPEARKPGGFAAFIRRVVR